MLQEGDRLGARGRRGRSSIAAGDGVASPACSTRCTGRWSSAGEGSGRLEEALDRIAYQLERLDALRRQVRSAMTYPAVVFGLALVVMIVVVAIIVPVFVNIFNQISADNPDVEHQPSADDPDHGRASRTSSRTSGTS